MIRELYLTPGGSVIQASVAEPGQIPGRDAIGVLVRVSHPTGEARFLVAIDVLVSFDGLHSSSSRSDDITKQPQRALALLAVIDKIDTDSSALIQGSDISVDVCAPDADRLLARPALSDRELRRFLARWVYAVYGRSTLAASVPFTRIDELITGCDATAISRNVGVLTAEGYFAPPRELGSNAVQPTVKLVREVERYGAAKEDAVGERDYTASLQAYSILAPHRDGVILEWHRYSNARTATELASVFRALAPYVEATLRDVLTSHESNKAHSTLAPMISELQQRKLGDRGMLSQLNHIIVFARDLAAHGAALSEHAFKN
jgi:hypothetical protein